MLVITYYNCFLQYFEKITKNDAKLFLRFPQIFRIVCIDSHTFLCLSVRKINQSFLEFLSKCFRICLYFFDNFPPFAKVFVRGQSN